MLMMSPGACTRTRRHCRCCCCRMVQYAESEVAELAREAAKADAYARATRKAEAGQGQQLELQRLKVRGGSRPLSRGGGRAKGSRCWCHIDCGQLMQSMLCADDSIQLLVAQT
jgi:hypothetical protein